MVIPSLPHARGGVSAAGGPRRPKGPSSPRPWGCFSIALSKLTVEGVFPTPVGVFPARMIYATSWGKSSPRPWGCFLRRKPLHVVHAVFPTPVGVFLMRTAIMTGSRCLPHARGGVSWRGDRSSSPLSSSPRPWGCFSLPAVHPLFLDVFPTPVGVFQGGSPPVPILSSLPHARGGVSLTP